MKSTDDIEVRWAVPGDVFPVSSISEFEPVSLQRFLEDPANVLIVALSEGRIVGLLRAHRLARYDGRGDEVLLNEIDVEPDWRRKGVATRLVSCLKGWARDERCSEIWIPTNASNAAAMRLYEKTGFTRTHDDDVIMQLDLH